MGIGHAPTFLLGTTGRRRQRHLLGTGLPTFKPAALAGHHADGVLLAFVVDDIDGEYARITAEGVDVTTPIETEPSSERFSR